MSIHSSRKAFTLIELLIVVAIIAILAAIAVPNFLEAQVRAKVSRTLTDFRTIKVGLESYRVDNNKYPETDTGQTQLNQRGFGLYRITTPIAYLTSIAKSPFKEDKLGSPAGSPQNAKKNGHVLYIRQKGPPTDPNADSADDTNYSQDRVVYLLGQPNLTLANTGFSRQGFYGLKSVGPDNVDNRDSLPPNNQVASDARVYDPTNGTVSAGDIVTYQDTSISGKP